jgi:regulator of sigma E protease
MSSITTILQLIIVLSALLILHEIGHYIGARLFKLEVDEFGIGIPPQLLRFWRRKGSIQIGTSHIKIPGGFKFLQDLEIGMWVDAIVQNQENNTYLLTQLKVLNPATDDLSPKNEPVEGGKIRIRGDITALNLGMLFTLNWLPLGGFVKIRGEGDPSVPEGLALANPWKRLVVYGFGPLMNLLMGVVLYAVIVSQLGMPDPYQVLVAEIAAGSPAENAGLQVGDKILEIAGTEISGMSSIHEVVSANLGVETQLSYLRGDEIQVVSLVPRENPPEGEGAIGIVMANPTVPINWFEAIPLGVASTYHHSIALITLPSQVIRGAISPEQARPVGYKGMYDIYQNVQERELVPGAPQSLNTIWFFTTITISLGILNLLPIPALDGGRILFVLPEIIFHRRIPIEVQNLINMVSFTIMILLFFYINYLDFANPVQLP